MLKSEMIKNKAKLTVHHRRVDISTIPERWQISRCLAAVECV